MTVVDYVFWGLTALTIGSASVVAFSPNIVRSALALLSTFLGVAGLYVLLGLDFLAGVQMFVYVGGVLVLVLFAVMMTQRIRDVHASNPAQNAPSALFVCGLCLMSLWWVFVTTDWGAVRAALVGTQDVFSAQARVPRLSEIAGTPGAEAMAPPSTAATGDAFLTGYLLPFEVVSVLLLVALMGAAIIVRKELADGEGGGSDA